MFLRNGRAQMDKPKPYWTEFTICLYCQETEILFGQDYCDDCRREHYEVIAALESDPAAKQVYIDARKEHINRLRKEDYREPDKFDPKKKKEFIRYDPSADELAAQFGAEDQDDEL